MAVFPWRKLSAPWSEWWLNNHADCRKADKTKAIGLKNN